MYTRLNVESLKRQPTVLNLYIIIMGEYTVYKHVNRINRKQYIGITKQDPQNRWGNDGINYKTCPRFWNAICKYGWDNFEHIILGTDLSKSVARKMEKDLIKEFKTQDKEYGYNILEGGQCGELPKEVREKMSMSMKGNKNGLGHPCSEEKKKKISDAQKGKKLSEEHKRAISLAKTGKSHKSLSEEARKKISNSHKKNKIYCLETDTVYESIQECSRQLNVLATNICKCCKGKINSTGGYHFSYYIQ